MENSVYKLIERLHVLQDLLDDQLDDCTRLAGSVARCANNPRRARIWAAELCEAEAEVDAIKREMQHIHASLNQMGVKV